MPYIKKELREELEYPLDVITGHINGILCDKPEDRAGILNYVITVLIDNTYGPLSDAKYKDYNEAIGMLECCKLEFYRKAAAPYEDMKEKQNGKVLDGGNDGNGRFGLAGKDLTRQQQIPAYSLEHGLKQSPYPVGYLAKNLSVWGELIYPSNEIFDDYVVFKLKINKNLSLFILGRSREDGEKVMNNWLKVQRTLNSDSVPLSYIELGDITGYFNFYKNFCDLELKIKNIFLAEENKEIPKIILFSKNKKKLIRKGIK